MKMTLPAVLTGAVLLIVACPTAANAQTTRPSSAGASSMPHKIGLVDVGYIFDNYQKLKDRRAALQAEIEASANDPEIAGIKQQIESLQAQLEKVTKGSDKAVELEQQLIELNAKGQARLASLKREFMRKEVNMYKEVYDEVARMVEHYATAKHYTLVLRYQRGPVGEEANVKDPRQMMNRVNQLVVYHQSGDDMTDPILEWMNGQYAKAGGQPATSPTGRTAAGSTGASRN